MPTKNIVAYDTNTARFQQLIPFLTKTQDKFHVVIPAMVYLEMGYSFLLKGDSIENYDEELTTYNAEVIPFTREHLQNTIILAHANRKTLPFREHSRDYLIAGQCLDFVEIFITYNVRRFKVMKLSTTRFMIPEDFALEFAPE